MDLFAGLSQELLNKIKSQQTLKKIKKGDFLYRQNDNPVALFIVQKGLLGLVINTKSGHEHLLRLFKKNQFLGHRSLFAGEPYHASSVALQDSEVLVVPKTCIMQMIDMDPNVSKHFLKVLSQELKMAELQRVTLSTQEVDKRVIEAILYIKDIDSEHHWTRKEIADFIGSTGPTVTKVLIKLKKQGLLRFNLRQIDILDRTKLLKLIENT